MTIFYKPLCVALCLGLSGAVHAFDNLEIKLRTSYPQEAKTVKEAAEYLLEPVGYKLDAFNKYANGAADIAFGAITPINRQVRTMTIYDALQALIGVENTILVDHKHKIISFQKGVNGK